MPDRRAAAAEATAIARGVENLVARYGLAQAAAKKLVCLGELLRSDPLAPTSIRKPRAVVEEHLADSLVALELSEVRSAKVVADLGAGAGVPGLPLAIALPGTRVLLVESNARKCAFIERAITRCGIENAGVVNARAEAWREGISAVDLVTARALGPPAVVAEYAAPLLTRGGALVLWRGQRDPEAERASMRAGQELGLEHAEPIPVVPYQGSTSRHLQLMLKVRETPSRFPRRPGAAAKRPLGGRPVGKGDGESR